MATTPTNLPVPSESPFDTKFNAGKIDEFVTSLALQYIDRFGNAHYTIEGLRWLAQQAIAQYGWILIDSFQDGADITLPNQALRDEVTGEYYRWDGALPKHVDAGSTPSTSGGVGIGAWVGIGDAALRTMLASASDGAGDALIAVKQPITGSVSRTQHDFNADFISVKDFGAVGDWNSTTQTGTDDTAAFQAAINALGATYRNGGKRVIYIPRGNYKITSLTIPSQFADDFGLYIFGDGKFSSIIWSDPANTNPTFDSQIDFVHFDSLGLFGALSQTSSYASMKSCFYKGKLASNAPDIDVTFTNCALGHANDFIQAYGRGVIVDNTCVAFFCLRLLNIVCDPSTTFPGGDTNSTETGMRNYRISPARTDVVSRLVYVSGTGVQKDFINDIIIDCPDILSADYLVEFPDATITGLTVNGGNALNSFSGGPISGKRLINSSIHINAAKQFNRNLVSTNRMAGIVTLTGAASNLRVSGIYRDLITHAVKVGAQSSMVTIDIDAPNLASNAATFTAFLGASCSGLDVKVKANNPGSADLYPWVATAQTSPQAKAMGYGIKFLNAYALYTPQLRIGGATATVNYIQGRFYDDGDKITATVGLSYTKPGSPTSSEVSVTLPTAVSAEFPGLSATVSGSAKVKHSSMKTIMFAEVYQPSGAILLYKTDGTTVKESDLPSSFVLTVEATYTK